MFELDFNDEHPEPVLPLDGDLDVIVNELLEELFSDD